MSTRLPRAKRGEARQLRAAQELPETPRAPTPGQMAAPLTRGIRPVRASRGSSNLDTPTQKTAVRHDSGKCAVGVESDDSSQKRSSLGVGVSFGAFRDASQMVFGESPGSGRGEPSRVSHPQGKPRAEFQAIPDRGILGIGPQCRLSMNKSDNFCRQSLIREIRVVWPPGRL